MMDEKRQDVAIVDLKQPEGVRLLAGKMAGLQARQRFGIDDLDRADRAVVVKIPVPVVTSSFILGMFSQSVRELGVDGFFRKYQFEANSSVLENIRVNARYSATESSALT